MEGASESCSFGIISVPLWYEVADNWAFPWHNSGIRSWGGSLEASAGVSLRGKNRSSLSVYLRSPPHFCLCRNSELFTPEGKHVTTRRGRGGWRACKHDNSVIRKAEQWNYICSVVRLRLGIYLVVRYLFFSVDPEENRLLRVVALHLHHDVIFVGLHFGAARKNSRFRLYCSWSGEESWRMVLSDFHSDCVTVLMKLCFTISFVWSEIKHIQFSF